MGDLDVPLLQKLNHETAKIPWRDLQRFFAQGNAIAVGPGLDLLQVAVAVSEDQSGLVESWLQGGQLAKVSDEQALQWHDDDSLVWTVVVKPWVLVQAALAG
jgi:hypothetical protein